MLEEATIKCKLTSHTTLEVTTTTKEATIKVITRMCQVKVTTTRGLLNSIKRKNITTIRVIRSNRIIILVIREILQDGKHL